MAGGNEFRRQGFIPDIEVEAVGSERIQQCVIDLADEILRGLLGQRLAQGEQVGQVEGDENRMIEPAVFADGFGDLPDGFGRHVVFELQHADFFIFFADAGILGKLRQKEIGAAAPSVRIEQADPAQRFEGCLFNGV